MPDITMCTGRNGKVVCPLASQCYRHTADPNPRRQSWMNAPIASAEEVCESYWVSRASQGL